MIVELASNPPRGCPHLDTRGIELHDRHDTLIRPLQPNDHQLYGEFSRYVTPEDHRLRFFSAAGGLTPARAWGFTHYDPREARAYIALHRVTGAMLGVGRVHRTGPDEGEFAVLVRSDLKGRGLGHELMESVLCGAAELQLRTVWGLVLRENTHMLALARDLAFEIAPFSGEPGIVKVHRSLRMAERAPEDAAAG